MILRLDIQMEQLSIWNDITTIKQRYLNLLHGMTRVDQHPRRLHSGKNTNEIIFTIYKRLDLKFNFKIFYRIME